MAEIDLGKVVGDTPVITATASVDANTGTPSVTVTQTGTAAAPTIDFAFHNLKGEGGGGGSSDISAIAPAFSENTAYSVGDYLTYENKLYRCTTAHPAGAWVAGDFTETTVDSDFMAKNRDYVNAGRKANTTVGDRSTAEGYNNTASGSYSHTEGYNCTASGSCASASGNSTMASGSYSSSNGQNSRATAKCAFAEGSNTLAGHEASHSGGKDTQTGNSYQCVQGKFNVGKSTTAFEIGNGSSSSNRLNAFEVAWTGDVVAAGDITDGNGNVLKNKMQPLTLLCEVSSTGWSQTTDADGYYTNNVSFGSNTIKPAYRPIISACGSTINTQETAAQAAAYSLCSIFYFADSDSVSSMTVKAKTKPTETFYVTVSGNGT